MATRVPYTTAAAAIGVNDDRVSLTSGTNAAANKLLVFTANKEAMLIREMIDATTARVLRGQHGTNKVGHDILDRCYVASPIAFANNDPFGVASATAVPYLPRVVLPTCKVFVPYGTKWLEIMASQFPPRVFTKRQRATLAEVNAGVEILPALPGYAYRLVTANIIAVGGAAAAGTTVDLIATLAASTRKLVAWAQASLTQSNRLEAGVSGAAILADGASFTLNDENTAVTLGKTGSSFTTATHFDLEAEFVIEPA